MNTRSNSRPLLECVDEQATARMQDHEIRPTLLRADRHVVPDETFVFELVLEALRNAPFARRHAWQASVA